MKWKNKGKELERFFDEWGLEQEYILWGTGKTAVNLLKKFQGKLKIIGFTDNNKERLKTEFQGYPPLLPEEVLCRGKKIIIASDAVGSISRQLEALSLKRNRDFCDSRYFVATYWYYMFGEVHFQRIDISITSFCNLNCKKCNMLMPYFKKKTHKKAEDIKRDIRAYFQWVDYVQDFNLLGGEPFLHPEIDDIIEYLNENFKEKIGDIILFSNGTVPLRESTVALIKQCNAVIQVSDYGIHSRSKAYTVDQFLERLETEGLNYYKTRNVEWLDFEVPFYQNNRSEQEMIVFFDRCHPSFRGLHDRKLFFCHLNAAAIMAGLFPENKNDYFDLENYQEKRKIELIEFNLGYNELGYLTYCRRCRGCDSVNDKFVPVAEQMK